MLSIFSERLIKICKHILSEEEEEEEEALAAMGAHIFELAPDGTVDAEIQTGRKSLKFRGGCGVACHPFERYAPKLRQNITQQSTPRPNSDPVRDQAHELTRSCPEAAIFFCRMLQKMSPSLGNVSNYLPNASEYEGLSAECFSMLSQALPNF